MGTRKKGLSISVAGSDGEFKQLRPDIILGRAILGDDDFDPEGRTIEIKGATLKDDFCNYDYEFIRGVGTGDSVSRKGSNIVHNDLKEVFKKLCPHLAVICEEIPSDSFSDIEGISDYDEDIHSEGSLEYKVSRFHVSAFKMNSTGENESVMLIGTKMLSTGEFVELKSPKKSWQGEYVYINELRVAIDDCRQEVERYMNGKAAPKLVQQELFQKQAEESSTEE